MKKTYLFIFIILILGGIVFLNWYSPQEGGDNNGGIVKACQDQEMIFYFHPQCGWCNKVKDEQTISKLEDLGVSVTSVNVTTDPINHQFNGVPTFIINEKVHSGYKTLGQLKSLLGC